MKLRLALAQINTIVGDLQGNAQRILQATELARKQSADLVVFPELSLTGYPPEDLLLRSAFIEDCLQQLRNLASEIQDITAVVGYPEEYHHSLYNSAAILADHAIRGVYRKIRLPNYGVFDEKRYFTPGREKRVFHICGVPVGINICEDIWTDEITAEQCRKYGARLIVNLSSSPYYRQKGQERRTMLSARAAKHRVPIAYVNLVGGQDELVFDGQSYLFGPDGTLFLAGPQFEESLLLADLRFDDLHEVRIEPQQGLVRSMEPIPEIYQALVTGTRDYVRKNGFRDVVLGMSGGIDSALVGIIAVDALDAEHVHAVIMPSPYTSQISLRDAHQLADNTGMHRLDIPIGEAMQMYDRMLARNFAGCNADVTEENIQARIRGNLLMALSNKFGWLVLSTGNKSEVSTGYCTLYGDMAGGFAVIKDVRKTLVYELCKDRNHQSGGELIPTSIIEREPTAELRDHQKDSDSLPPYGIMDPILELYLEQGLEARDIIARGFDEDTVRKVIRLIVHSEYKRRQAPPGIKITPRAFGKDHRMPITNWYYHR